MSYYPTPRSHGDTYMGYPSHPDRGESYYGGGTMHGRGYYESDHGHYGYHDTSSRDPGGYYGRNFGSTYDNAYDYDTRPWARRAAGAGGGGAAAAAGCYGCGCSVEGPPKLSFVGVGSGDYVQELRYVYVGEGAGEFEPSPKTMTNHCAVWGCFGFVFLIILIVVLWFIIPSNTTTTTYWTATSSVAPFDCSGWPHGWSTAKKQYCCNTAGKGCETTAEPPTPPSGIKYCLIWGDPHIRTFDNGRADFYGEGEVWIIKNQVVHIQAKYMATPFTNGLAATETLAIGGPFLHGHIFKVGPLETGSITWDGQPVLTLFPSTFDPAGLGTIRYNGEGELVDNAMINLKKFIVHVDFPKYHLHIQIMRWSHHINVRISCPLLPGGLDGHCGNYNGNPDDDGTEEILARVGTSIPPDESLFRIPMPYHDVGRRGLDCEPSREQEAREKCQVARPHIAPDELEACIFDVCNGGTRYALQDAVYNNRLGAMTSSGGLCTEVSSADRRATSGAFRIPGGLVIAAGAWSCCAGGSPKARCASRMNQPVVSSG
eukprot:CAMPEP_0170381788 /NCGR_PEP_ID=MMETSP0117_2-20130122/14596_1 /TAXON_ID=400756 /ORGANISM="Durinskia baltica, Strain CSIRO CS-38" /LENGTH=542 /DNA_ID=CAMNT_0010637383 /DNA_START=138 /DNA_END=1763 /DNA_ORIENTATION=-